MSLWRMARDEMAGAWRSLRYDLRRRSDADARRATEFHDATSNEVSTFGGPGTDPYSVHDEYARPPRRLVAVSAFGLLALVGAAGSYFAVVNGLGDLLAEGPPGSGPFPLVAEAAPAPPGTVRQAPTARLGYGAPIAPSPTPLTAPLRAKAAFPGSTSTKGPAAEGGVAPRTAAPTKTPCRCAPPAPIPTFPSAGPRPSGTPSTGSPSVSPTPSTSTPPSPGPSPGAPYDDVAGPPHERSGY